LHKKFSDTCRVALSPETEREISQFTEPKIEFSLPAIRRPDSVLRRRHQRAVPVLMPPGSCLRTIPASISTARTLVDGRTQHRFWPADRRQRKFNFGSVNWLISRSVSGESATTTRVSENFLCNRYRSAMARRLGGSRLSREQTRTNLR